MIRPARPVVLVATAWLLCAPASAQRPAPAGTCSISGTAVTAEGQPLRAVRVSAEAGGLRTPKTAITGDDGRFVFTALPAGDFTVTASRAGYVTVAYGQKPGRSPVAVHVESAGHADGLVLRMVRGAAITGTIRDQLGDPAPGIEVGAARWDTRGGVRRLSVVVTTETDDRGVYRLFGLPAGQYVVAMSPRASVGDTRDAAAALDPAVLRSGSAAAGALARFLAAVPVNEPASLYAPLFYPGTPLETNASLVTVAAGEESSGIDIALSLVPAVTVSGVVTGPGGPSAGIRVTMTFSYSVLGASQNVATTRPDGSFSFTRVRPGQYTIVAQSGGTGRGATPSAEEPLWAMASVEVDGTVPVNVSMPLAPGASVSGRIVRDVRGAAPPDSTSIQIALRPFLSAGAAAPIVIGTRLVGTPDPAGAFSIDNVAPGRYLVEPSFVGEGLTLVSAVIKGQDAADTPIDIGPSERVTGAVVTIASGVTEIAGRARDAGGAAAIDATVIAFSADRAHWIIQSRRIRAIQPNSSGDFVMRNLPPGEYRLVAVTNLEPGSWFDPAVLDALQSTSTLFTLGLGEKKRLDLVTGKRVQ